MLGRIFQISAQKWAFIGRRALNRGERLLRFPRRNVPGKFTAFTKSEAMGKTLKKEVTQRTYPRGILFDNMALDVGAYLGKMNRNGITGQFVVDIVSNLAEIFTTCREKMWGFLHEAQQTLGLKFGGQLKMKSTS